MSVYQQMTFIRFHWLFLFSIIYYGSRDPIVYLGHGSWWVAVNWLHTSRAQYTFISSVFTGIANTTEVAGESYINTENTQMAFIGDIFTSTYYTKQLYPWLNTSASQVVNYSLLTACQGEMHAWSHLKPTRALMNIRQARERYLSRSRL